jgi:6-phosphogluconolactonase
METNSIKSHTKFNLLVGTYTNTSCNSSGIYIFEFDAISGDLQLINNSEKVINPSYLSVSTDNKYVYAVNEDETKGSVSAFAYNSKEHTLTFLNKNDSLGAAPCQLIDDEQNVIAANYAGGSIAVFKKMPDQSISEACQLIQHEGKGIDKDRQEKAHVHMVYFSPDKKFVLANDLGLDKVFIYEYAPHSGDKILTFKDAIDLKAGSGPRHSAFSENGDFIFLFHELDGTLTTLRNNKNGSLEILSEIDSTPENFNGSASSAAIKISPDGKILYVSHRGDLNSISIYKILKSGQIDFVERISTGGKEPRDFAIDPLGNFLLVGHEETNNIVIFKRDKISGKLINTGQVIDICAPVNLIFTEVA